MSKKPRKATKADLLGRCAVIQFPNSTARITYGTKGMMQWEVTDKSGKVTNGEERAAILQLTEDLFFLNWREKTGFTVSQLIDTWKGEVTAFWTYADGERHTQRASLFVKGTVVMTGGAA